jgi:hypothetical protein
MVAIFRPSANLVAALTLGAGSIARRWIWPRTDYARHVAWPIKQPDKRACFDRFNRQDRSKNIKRLNRRNRWMTGLSLMDAFLGAFPAIIALLGIVCRNSASGSRRFGGR